jgi:hypothetical protein
LILLNPKGISMIKARADSFIIKRGMDRWARFFIIIDRYPTTYSLALRT